MGDDEKELHDATRDLISVVNGAASRHASEAVKFLLWRQEKDQAHIRALEEKLILQQRHLQMIDRLLEERLPMGEDATPATGHR